jgi:hypothetical protein
MGNRLKGVMFDILHRRDYYCISHLATWLSVRPWWDVILSDERIYKLAITEVILLLLGKDRIDAELTTWHGIGSYSRRDCGYCFKCENLREVAEGEEWAKR